jgi:hypothetical protein
MYFYVVGAQALCPTCEEPLTVDLSVTSLSTAADDVITKSDEMSPSGHSPLSIGTSRILSIANRGPKKGSLLSKLPQLDDFQSSTKIEALMEEIATMQAHDPSAKGIVFSQFVNMLDLIEHRLTLGGIKCVKLSGHLSMVQREMLLTMFRQDPAIPIFLISLKAGGVALNLTVASQYVWLWKCIQSWACLETGVVYPDDQASRYKYRFIRILVVSLCVHPRQSQETEKKSSWIERFVHASLFLDATKLFIEYR